MKKILFITDNFPPEVNAPASRTYDHCKEWVKAGADVTVITCAPNFPQGKVYEGYKNKIYQKESIDGIKVIRVWSYIVPNCGFIKRTLDYISFSITAFIAGLFIKTDIIIATSPQFFVALTGRALSRVKSHPWIMEVRDLWPESIKTVGAMNDNVIIRYFEWQEKRCYNSATKIIVVTDSFKRTLINRGINSNKIEVIKNGVNTTLFTPREKDQILLNSLNLKGKKVIGYIGTHGLAHKLDFVLNCAKSLESYKDIHFLLIGDGAAKAQLLKLKEDLKCKNVTMLPSVSKNEVARYISILDVCLINLKKSQLFKTVIPSKIFENAGMQKPILMGVEGEAKDIIESYGAGICFEPENEFDFKAKLFQILEPQVYNDCKKGCKKITEDFDRKTLAKKMLTIINSSTR